MRRISLFFSSFRCSLEMELILNRTRVTSDVEHGCHISNWHHCRLGVHSRNPILLCLCEFSNACGRHIRMPIDENCAKFPRLDTELCIAISENSCSVSLWVLLRRICVYVAKMVTRYMVRHVNIWTSCLWSYDIEWTKQYYILYPWDRYRLSPFIQFDLNSAIWAWEESALGMDFLVLGNVCAMVTFNALFYVVYNYWTYGKKRTLHTYTELFHLMKFYFSFSSSYLFSTNRGLRGLSRYDRFVFTDDFSFFVPLFCMCAGRWQNGMCKSFFVFTIYPIAYINWRNEKKKFLSSFINRRH